MLADRNTGLFFLDGAGVAKGRTIAVLIWQQRRRKALWNFVASDLKFDAHKDLDDVGATCIEGIDVNLFAFDDSRLFSWFKSTILIFFRFFVCFLHIYIFKLKSLGCPRVELA